MKLHLPKGLRAALIAAFAAVGTLAQAGITTYDVTSWASYNPTAGAAVVGNGIAQTFDYTQDFNTNWNFVVTVNAASIQNDSALTLLALSLQQSGGTGLAEGITLADNGTPTATLTSWSSAAAGGAQTLDLTDVTTLTFVLTRTEDKNLTMKVYADDNFSSAIATATQGGQSFSGTKVDHVALGGTGGMSRYNHSANQVTFPDDATTGTFEITKAGYLFNSVVSENDLIKYYNPPSTLVWNSTSSATWDLTTTNWVPQGETTPVVFVDYASAVFGSGSSLVKSVEVEGSVNVDVMTVQDNYTFTAGSGSALMMDALNVAAGKTVTLAGEGYFDITHLGGNISIAAEATVDLGDIITLSATQPLPVSGEGRLGLSTLKVEGGEHTITNNLAVMGGGDGTGGTNRSLGLAVTNAAANITLLGDTHITGALYAQVGTVNIGNGTKAVRVETNRVEFGDTGGNGTSTLNVNKNATLHVRAGDVPNAYASTGLVMGEWGGVSVANVYGKLYADNATAYVGDNTVTFNIEEGGLMAVKGFSQNQHKDAKTETVNLNLKDGGTVVLGDNGIASQKPINVSFAAGEVGISGFDVEIAKDVTLSGSGTTFNTTVYEWQGSDNTLELVLGEDIGAITVRGNITGDGAIIKTGGGALVLAGDANVITHTISLQEGELVLRGAYDVSALAGGSGEDYVDGEVEGNGFLSHGELIAHVVDIAADTSLSSDGIFTVNGAEGSFDTATGNATFDSGISYTTLYVNVASTAEGLAHAMETAAAQGAQIGDVRLANNTTLNMNSAAAVLPLLTVAADADAAVNVTESAAITKATGAAEGHTLTINGTAGSTLTIGATGADSYAGAGTLVIAEGATVLLRGNNTNFTGNIEVNGTLIVGTGINANVGTGVFGAENIAATSTRTFTINSTGVLDFNGQPDTKYAYVLAGGKLTNSGNDIPEGKAQMSGLKLTADSTVEAGSGHEFWLLSAGHAANTLDLGDNKLVKTGDGRFGFKTTSISAGTLEAREGVIHFSNSNTVANMLLSGGTFTGGVDVKGDITVHATVGADMSAALNIAEAGKVITFDVDADQTLNQTGMVNGAGSIVKNGNGILVMSGAAGTTTPGTLTGVQVNAGTLKVTAANVLGTGGITVVAGATLDMTAGNVLAGTQTVTNSGNVIIHNTLTSGSVNGGSLILAGDFPTTGEFLDVDGLDTGNGFSQGGTIQVFDPTKATLDVTEIKHGDTTYHMDNLKAGAITLSGADWSIYQLNGAAQYAVQAIMDYATGKGGELKTISVNDDMLTIENDSTTLKTSMLGGEHLATFAVYMSGTSALTIDGNCAAAISTNTGADGTITLAADATVGSIVAGDFENNGAGNLTINGEGHTVTSDGAGVAFGSVLTIGKGVSLEMLHDTSFTTMQNATVALKEGSSLVLNEASFATVEGGTEATIKVTSDEYLPLYDPSFAEYSITGARITLNTTANFDLGHEIDATSQVVNAGTGTMRDISTNEKYAELNAKGGDIYISTPMASGIETRALAVGDLILAEGRTVGEDTGKAVSITVSGEASFGSGSTVGAALTMAGGSTLDAAEPVALADHALAIESGVTIGESLWSTISSLAAETSATIFTGVSTLTLNGAQYSEDVDLKDIFNHADLKANKYVLGYDATGKNVTITRLTDNNRYWKGGNGTWNYSTTAPLAWTDVEGGADAAFVNGYNAYFAATTGGTITLGENVTAESITVSGADYIFSPGTYSLTVNKSVEADAHKATFNMALSGTGLKLIAKNGGTITLANGGSVKDVEIGTGSSLEVSSATLTVADGFVNNGSLTADTLDLKKGTAQGGNVSAGTLKLASGQSYTFGNLNAATISGTDADLTIGDGATLNAATAATLKSLTTGDSAQLGGNITVAGATNIGGATLTGNLTTASLTGGTLRVNNNGNLTLTSSGTLGDVEFTGTNSLTIAGTATATLDGALSNANTLTLKGKFDASNLPASKSDSKYVEGGTPGNGNGFEQARLTLTIVNGGTTSANDATIVYRTKTLTEKVGTDGKVTFDGDVDYTKFYVNTGFENASTAMNNAKWTSASSFELKGGTWLVADRDIDINMVNTAGVAGLEIANGHRVTSNGQPTILLLAGSGTYALASGVNELGVVLNDSWSGTVSFTAAQLDTLEGSWKSGSTVSLTGVTGSLGNTAVGADIVLNKGEGDWGFGQTVNGTITLNGAITGEGNLGVKSDTATSTIILGGDINGWNGNFVANNANATLKLTGGDKTVNGTVNGSNLALVVETNATLKSDSTVARVNATAGSLKVDAGKRLTVTDTILPDNIKLGAGASIAAAFMGGSEYGYMDGTIANETGGDQDVSIHNADITVTGATLCTNGGTGFTVDNKLVDAKLLVAETLTQAVALNNVQDSLEVVDGLAIGAGGSLKVANGGAKQELVIGGGTTLTLADGTTLDANVAIGSGATLTLNYNTAGTPVATTLNNGSLALANGLTLSGNVYDKMAALTDADDNTVVDLFQGVGALTLGGSAYTGEVKATQYFTNLTALSDLGDFTLLYNDSTDVVSIRFNITQARTLTWNGTEGDSTWEIGEGTATNWLDATQQETHFASGDTAKFTGDAAYKEVTIAATTTEARDVTVSGEEAQYGFVVNDGTSKLVVDNLMKVADGAALAKKGEGDLVLDLNAALTVDGATLAVEDGTLYVGTPAKNGTLDLKNAAVNIAQGATLSANTITGDADTTIAMDGTLHVGGGSIQGLTAGENSKLAINLGTLTIATDTTLYGLTSSGTLDLGTRELTLADATEYGGNVTAGTLNFSEFGSTFGDLKVNTIHYAYDMEGAGTIDYVEVGTIAANGAGKITLDMTDVRGNGGSLAPIQRTGGEITYTLVHATGQALDAAGFTLDAATLEALVQNGLIREGAGLVVSEDNASLQLTIGGLGQDLTWYTSKDTTEWGYKVMNGDDLAHGANTLNGVQHVVVDEDRTIDVTSVADDAVLRVRNIIGAANKTVTFTGEHSDAVALIATEDTSSDVNVAAKHILLGVGLPETDDIDPIEYDADLHVGSVKLTDALLVVTNDASFSVDRLNGDEDSMISGAVTIEGQGGAYRGEYAGADITVAEDAEATLYAGESLKLYGEGTVKLVYTKSTEIDGVNADGMTLVLNNPNASIIGSTLTLQDESGLTNGTLVFGMSAIESAKRIDSTQTPQIIEGSLVLGDGTTVVVNQDDLADSGIAMVVNNGRTYRNLALAYIGNEETYTDSVLLNGYLYGKYYKNARVEAGELLVDMRDDFYQDLTKATTPNGRAGAGMLDDALRELNPQAYEDTWSGDLATVMTALESGAIPQRSADRVAAAMSGASAAAMGAAWSHDVDRQLRAIRNRTTSMGVANCEVNEDMPYFNAWVNAEGDYSKLSADGTLAGYKLSSWGGTLGFDVDFTPAFTAGLALTVMKGDYTAESADVAKGDLDRLYVTVFGRYTHRAWTHTLVATFGTADTKLERTVDYGVGSYRANADSDGRAFGIMYEAGYAKALNEDGSTCIQPMVNLSYRTSSLSGYTEKGGSDAALKVGDAKANVFTAALGARLQSTIGTSVYNRASIFEGRVLVKGDAGDRDVAVNNAFTGVHSTRKVKSAELGAFGVEVGAGVIIPLGESAGSLFLDASGEFRAKYTEINGTVGYRFNF